MAQSLTVHIKYTTCLNSCKQKKAQISDGSLGEESDVSLSESYPQIDFEELLLQFSKINKKNGETFFNLDPTALVSWYKLTTGSAKFSESVFFLKVHVYCPVFWQLAKLQMS